MILGFKFHLSIIYCYPSFLKHICLRFLASAGLSSASAKFDLFNFIIYCFFYLIIFCFTIIIAKWFGALNCFYSECLLHFCFNFNLILSLILKNFNFCLHADDLSFYHIICFTHGSLIHLIG